MRVRVKPAPRANGLGPERQRQFRPILGKHLLVGLILGRLRIQDQAVKVENKTAGFYRFAPLSD